MPLFCPLISTMHEQSRCSTSQFVPLRVKNNLKSSPTRLILRQCKSTQLTAPLHHEGKLCSTCLVVYCFSSRLYLQLSLTFRPRCHPSLAMFSKVDLSLVPSMCFYPRDYLRFNLDNCCCLDTRISPINDRRK